MFKDWAKHQHKWVVLDSTGVKENDKVTGQLVLQECIYCDAVRTIEYNTKGPKVIMSDHK